MGLHRRPSPRRLAALSLGLGLITAGPLAAQTTPGQTPGTPPPVKAAGPSPAAAPAALPPISTDPAALTRQGPAPVTHFPYLGEVAPRPPLPLSPQGIDQLTEELQQAAEAARRQAETLRREEHIPDPVPTPPKLPGRTSDAGRAIATVAMAGDGSDKGLAGASGRAIGAATV